MRVIADLHIHSRYARACSVALNAENIGLWSDKKGITVVGTGDFLHPKWCEELQKDLVESETGLYRLKSKSANARFFLSTEIASIYKQGDKVRRVHNLIFAPNFRAVEKLTTALEKRGANLRSDGRPITGIHCDELLKICKDADQQIEVVPAHVWTPHFGVFGSLSGFDTLEECFGDQTKHIFAVETGISSDPGMNWQVGLLDNIALISNSDAHSLHKMGREANVFELADSQFSYQGIIQAMRNRNPKQFLYTIEFFPEEGRYHLDGHRDHKFSCLPEETKKYGGICPVCGKKLLRGVMSRVDDLATRAYGQKPKRTVPYKNVIPLEEVIAETYGVGVTSKKVTTAYESLIAKKTEFEILLDLQREEVAQLGGVDLAESIMRVREGRVSIQGGYDGLYGKIQIYTDKEKQVLKKKPAQPSLF